MNQTRRTAILILGCHRSGTSLLARGINAAGARLSDSLIAPAPDNPTGFWEDAEVVSLNRQILRSTGNTWDSVALNPLKHLRRRQHWREQAGRVLSENYSDESPFVIKDPTLCLLLPVWLEALKDQGIETRAVAILRSPLAVADSLKKRNGYSREKSLLIWLSYNWSLFTSPALQSLPLAVSDYDSLLSKPKQEMLRICHVIGFEADEQALVDFSDSFVDRALRHSAKPVSELSGESTPRLARQLSGRLFPLCDLNSSDAIHRELAELCEQPMGGQIAKRIDRFISRDRSEMVESLRSELDRRSQALDEALGWQKVASRLEVELADQATSYERQIKSMAEEHAASTNGYSRQIDKMQEELAAKDARYKTVITDINARADRALADLHAKYQPEIARLNADLERSSEEQDAVRQELQQVHRGYAAEIERLNAELKDVHSGYSSEIQRLNQQQEATTQRLQQLEQSWSFRVGRLITWPVRRPLVTWVLPWLRDSESGQLLLAAFRNPKRVLSLLKPRRVLNFLDILLRRRHLKHQVFSHYSERLSQPDRELIIPEQSPVDVQGLGFDLPEKPLVSVIIPVYNQLEYTLGCLQSICDHSSDCGFEVLVVDDGSTDATQATLERVPGLRYLRNPQNLQFLKSVNRAARYARGEYFFLLNNDTRVMAGWLDSLVDVFQRFPDAGVVGSRLLFPDGRLQEAGGIVWNDASAWNFGRLDDPQKPEYNYLKEVDYVSGAALMVRRDLFEQLGFFDERFVPAYYEDTDLCFAAREAGYRVLLQPRSNVVHVEGVSHGTDTESGVKQHQVDNQEKFLEKWRSVLQRDHFANGEQVFLARDRSRHRRTVLVIDHYVPHFDRDAGSRSTWHYLKLFVEQGFNVKFLGDNFFRHEPYTTSMEDLGIEVLLGNDYARNWREWLVDNASMIDVIYLHRPHITEKYLDTLARLSPCPRTIYFGHDLHHLRLERQAALEGSDKLRMEAAEWRRRELRIFDAVDLVYYPSQVEVDYILDECPGLNVKAIPLYIFDRAAVSDYSAGDRQDILFIGGFNHPPNVDGVLWFAELFGEIALSGVTLHIVGSKMPPEIRRLASERIVTHGFLSDEAVDALYGQVRLSVVPLRFGAGIKGKVLESMAKGVPVLTTDIGAEGIIEAEEGMQISSLDAFGEMLRSLYEDEHRLEALSAAGRRIIGTHYSVEAAREAVIGDFL